MRKQHVIIFVLAIVIIAIIIWPTSDFKVSSIEEGNAITLNNGTRVKLIGVSATEEGKQYIEENYKGSPVILFSDHSVPFNPSHLKGNETVYAYVSDKHGKCINAEMLRLGISEIQEGAYLSDSLKKFKRYYMMGKDVHPEPITPTPAPVINYREDDIRLPEYEFDMERRYNNWYNDGNQNIEMLEEACDYDLPYTKAFANDLAGRSKGSFNPGQICEIFKYCYNKWRYVNDPNGHEYVARASESIACNLSGDCDDFAVLIASCLLAVGADVCVNTGFNPDTGHAFTEVDISIFDKGVVLDIIREHFPQYDITMLNTREDGRHLWLNLDWWAAHPGGQYYSCSKRDAYSCVKGEWKWEKLF